MSRGARRIPYEELANNLASVLDRVRREHERIVVEKDGDAIAIVMPVNRGTSRRAEKSSADVAAFRSAAGGWKDVDTGRLVEDIYAERRRGDRPPVEL